MRIAEAALKTVIVTLLPEPQTDFIGASHRAR
jgi:hypothetical protein